MGDLWSRQCFESLKRFDAVCWSLWGGGLLDSPHVRYCGVNNNVRNNVRLLRMAASQRSNDARLMVGTTLLLSRKFFTSLLQHSSCLHILLPTPRDPTITTRLRAANTFPRLPSRTRKYQTFISYGLAHYQTS